MRYAQKQGKGGYVTNITTVLRFSGLARMRNRLVRVGGTIGLDGVENNMIHLVHTDDPDALVDGIRVRAILSEKRSVQILHIMHFRPV